MFYRLRPVRKRPSLSNVCNGRNAKFIEALREKFFLEPKDEDFINKTLVDTVFSNVCSRRNAKFIEAMRDYLDPKSEDFINRTLDTVFGEDNPSHLNFLHKFIKPVVQGRKKEKTIQWNLILRDLSAINTAWDHYAQLPENIELKTTTQYAAIVAREGKQDVMPLEEFRERKKAWIISVRKARLESNGGDADSSVVVSDSQRSAAGSSESEMEEESEIEEEVIELDVFGPKGGWDELDDNAWMQGEMDSDREIYASDQCKRPASGINEEEDEMETDSELALGNHRESPTVTSSGISIEDISEMDIDQEESSRSDLESSKVKENSDASTQLRRSSVPQHPVYIDWTSTWPVMTLFTHDLTSGQTSTPRDFERQSYSGPAAENMCIEEDDGPLRRDIWVDAYPYNVNGFGRGPGHRDITNWEQQKPRHGF
jgi:hypothetical protein